MSRCTRKCDIHVNNIQDILYMELISRGISVSLFKTHGIRKCINYIMQWNLSDYTVLFIYINGWKESQYFLTKTVFFFIHIYCLKKPCYSLTKTETVAETVANEGWWIYIYIYTYHIIYLSLRLWILYGDYLLKWSGVRILFVHYDESGSGILSSAG